MAGRPEDLEALRKRAEAAEAAFAEAMGALAPPTHNRECPKRLNPERPCQCGTDAANALRKSEREREILVELFDRYGVTCDNCGATIIARGGSRGEHYGVSKTGGDDETLCGFCAGEDLDAERAAHAETVAQVVMLRVALEASRELMAATARTVGFVCCQRYGSRLLGEHETTCALRMSTEALALPASELAAQVRQVVEALRLCEDAIDDDLRNAERADAAFRMASAALATPLARMVLGKEGV